jgi:hypothetical protein
MFIPNDDIRFNYNRALIEALRKRKGHIELVKYIDECNADIHANINESFKNIV